MSELYKFGKLDAKLTEWRFPVINAGLGFQVIKGVDFTRAYQSGSISFESDGVYLDYNGIKYRGYMHLAESYFSRFGNHPKFHLSKCKTIQEFIISGTFRQKYIWSNSNTVDLIDDTTGEEYEDIILDLCYNCKSAIFGKIKTTEDFFDSLDKTELETKNIEIDIFGYVKDWQKIGKAYRESKDYACESCGIKPKNNFDKRFWQTHHKDGDKTNNRQSNLECLCVLCHSYKDSIHIENFDKPRMKRMLDIFVKQYDEELKKIGNTDGSVLRIHAKP